MSEPYETQLSGVIKRYYIDPVRLKLDAGGIYVLKAPNLVSCRRDIPLREFVAGLKDAKAILNATLVSEEDIVGTVNSGTITLNDGTIIEYHS